MAIETINNRKQEKFKLKILQRFSEEINKAVSSSRIRDDKILRFELETGKIDPLAWLADQQGGAKIYWSDREKDFELAGIGKADEISWRQFQDLDSAFKTLEKRIKSSDGKLKYFGGIAFDQASKLDKLWDRFGKFYFIVPRFEVYNDSGKTFIAINICSGPDIDFKKASKDTLDQFEKIDFSGAGGEMQDLKIISRLDLPDKETWINNIDSVVKKIRETDTKKIVLARRTLLEARESINPLNILKMLKKVNRNTYDFYMQIDDKVSFLGCSPERLFKKKGRQILSEALAGSLSYKNNIRKNDSSGKRLLSSEKDIEEHQYVYDEIYKELQSLCEEIEVLNEKDVLTLSYVQHIFSRFKGRLKPSKQVPEIISCLHPTPAVFGFPVEGLKKEIKKYEPFERGWYASPLGWISKDDADFTVSIRSGLVNGNTISLFSGAGIVKGSVPEMEWEEIENKIYHFLKVLK